MKYERLVWAAFLGAAAGRAFPGNIWSCIIFVAVAVIAAASVRLLMDKG